MWEIKLNKELYIEDIIQENKNNMYAIIIG